MPDGRVGVRVDHRDVDANLMIPGAVEQSLEEYCLQRQALALSNETPGREQAPASASRPAAESGLPAAEAHAYAQHQSSAVVSSFSFIEAELEKLPRPPVSLVCGYCGLLCGAWRRPRDPRGKAAKRLHGAATLGDHVEMLTTPTHTDNHDLGLGHVGGLIPRRFRKLVKSRHSCEPVTQRPGETGRREADRSDRYPSELSSEASPASSALRYLIEEGCLLPSWKGVGDGPDDPHRGRGRGRRHVACGETGASFPVLRCNHKYFCCHIPRCG
ncbi:hypothetical protein GGR56DRAFT_437736 [Xylariaceae sp. FL0804]|nr:hypothetical protein GGR56DRAFT_437736 [Xylariaceae sp. FL0804]